jgi:tricarballylate dehydrogenase
MTIRSVEACLPWMEAHGVRFQPSLSGTLSLSRTNAFFLGGGKALVNAYYNTAEDLGVTVAYEAEVTHVHVEDGTGSPIDGEIGGQTQVRSRAARCVLASGGFQADLDWLAAPGGRRRATS